MTADADADQTPSETRCPDCQHEWMAHQGRNGGEHCAYTPFAGYRCLCRRKNPSIDAEDRLSAALWKGIYTMTADQTPTTEAGRWLTRGYPDDPTAADPVAICRVEAEAREGYITEDNCAHSQAEALRLALAEAAAPPGLDVALLRRAMASRESTDHEGFYSPTPEQVAAEYARLAEPEGDDHD